MIDLESKGKEVVETSVEHAQKTVDLFKAEWEARKDIAKTLITLSSASLVFTITFSQSVINAGTAFGWRYAVVACWLALICCLGFSLGSLWFSMGLASIPLLMMSDTKKIKDATKEAISVGDFKPLTSVMMKPFEKVTRQELIALWLLRGSAVCYGTALLILTVVGLRRLLY